MDGSSVVLHTRFSSVVFPAFALPITRMRKRVYLARSFAASPGSIITAGVGEAGGRGIGSSATGGDEAAGGGQEPGGGRGEKRTVMRWHTAGRVQNKTNKGGCRCKGARRLRDGF
jgi:hypothetical protein